MKYTLLISALLLGTGCEHGVEKVSYGVVAASMVPSYITSYPSQASQQGQGKKIPSIDHGFYLDNYEAIREQSAKGHGEAWETLLDMIGPKNRAEFVKLVQNNHSDFFHGEPNEAKYRHLMNVAWDYQYTQHRNALDGRHVNRRGRR